MASNFHGFRCKSGYDSGGYKTYMALCPILDNYPGFVELESMNARKTDIKRYEYSVLSYYDVKSINAEIADYLFINAFDLLICNIVEIDGIDRIDWWACMPGYYNDIFHPWWLENHEAFEADIDDYFAHHPFVR